VPGNYNILIGFSVQKRSDSNKTALLSRRAVNNI